MKSCDFSGDTTTLHALRQLLIVIIGSLQNYLLLYVVSPMLYSEAISC